LSQPRRGTNFNVTAYAVVIRFRADGLCSQPVSAVPTVISQYVSPLTHVANRDVEITIVVDISERRGQATRFEKCRRPALSRNGQTHFSGAAAVQDISCWVRYVRSCPLHAPVQRRGPSSHHCRNPQVRTPTGKSESQAAQARRVGRIPEADVAVEVIAFVGKIRDHNIRRASLSKSLKSMPIAASALPSIIVGNACGQADFGKRAISIVVVQETRHRIVGNKDVGETVAVIVGERYAQSFALGLAMSASAETSVNVPSPLLW